MPILPIVIGPDNPILRKKTSPVKKVTKELQRFIKDMILTMHEANGVGLAAPQVGSIDRVCIAVIGGKVVPMVNPRIRKKSKETAVDQEGCLSLPNVWLNVTRSVEITVEYLDAKGKKQERTLKNFDARVVQHEVDHLEGILIVDYQKAS
jgi:peptide deformylase